MRNARAAGPNAGAFKYDLLTALGTHACAQDKGTQRLVLRFITLVVARYNWTTDRLAVGQREIAALWSIDERSVKREMAKLRARGWLEQTRPAARGRVAEYALGLGAILTATRPDWVRVGSDFDRRLAGPTESSGGNVVAFPGPTAPNAPPVEVAGQGVWPQVSVALHRQDPHLFQAWFAPLVARAPQEGVLCLSAPSRFHATYLATNHAERILALARAIDPGLRRVEIGAEG